MRRVLLAFGLALLGAMPAGAQTPRAELFGGYAFLRDTSRAESVPAGWVVSAAGSVNDWVGVATEVGENYGTCENCQRGPFVSQRFRGTDLDVRIFTFMAGPRVSARALPVATPFAQVLVGGAHVSGGIEWDGALNTGFSWQPGGGVDVTATPRTAVRFQADYRIIRTQGRNNRQLRLAAGLVWRFGEL